MGSLTLLQVISRQGVMLASEVNVGVDGLLKYKLFGHTFWLTTTHVSLLIILLLFTVLAIVANRAIRKADPYGKPSAFVNVIELIVEKIDGMVVQNMGAKEGPRFANYIGTLFSFILVCNISGLFGLRAPTADYGTTLSLALITFVLIHYNGFKFQKMKHLTDLFKPVLLTPINIIGEISTPLSMSLRLFGNVLSGTVLMALIYGLLPKVILWFWPGLLHAYFDVFSGCIQTYVFCMLTMVYIANNFNEEA
ncbi:MAG: F0F1 ATP synthase subunit A [Lachnospiraceae bacterium]